MAKKKYKAKKPKGGTVFSWKKLSMVLAGIVLLSSAAGAFGVKDFKFWASPSDISALANKLIQIGQLSYSTAIRILNDKLVSVQDRLYVCVNSAPPRDCTHLRQQEADILREIAELQREQNR